MSNTNPANPISRTGRRMALAGSLLAGGIAIGSFVSPIGLAGAQDDTSSTLQSTVDDTEGNVETNDSPSTAATDAFERRHGRRGPGMMGDAAVIQDLLGLTSADLQAARADGQTLAEIAADQGMSESDLVAALVEEATVRIGAAVEDGRLDADRAATITDDLEARITEFVNRAPGERSAQGDGGRPGRDGRGGPGDRLLESDLFTGLGLDADELRTALQSGSTLAEAAAAQGVSEDDLAAALTTAAEERLAGAVADGRIDADEAAAIQAAIAERVQDRLDGIRPDRPGRGGHHDGADDSADDAED